jgi:pimeloyl-ACP methyl ester carboxylesterase
LHSLWPRIRLHALNSRGHGGSDAPASYPNWDGPLSDLRAYVRATFSAPVFLAGHSFGASLSLRLAAESPELVAGLLLLEPLLVAGRNETWPPSTEGYMAELIARTRERRDGWADRAEALAWLRTRAAYRDWAPEALRAFVASGLVDGAGGGVRLACPPWLEAEGYATLPGPVMHDWVRKVRVPTVILRAEGSPVVSPQALEEVLAAIPVAVRMNVKGSHSFPMEHPRAAGEALALGMDILLRARDGAAAGL